MTKTITLDAKKIKKLTKINEASEEIELKPLEIRNASIKEMQCNYGYELMTGKNKGDLIPNRKGAHMIHDDLKEAFSDLDVFLAHIDGAFSSWANNQSSLSELEAVQELAAYYVSAFKIVGVEENKSVIISGQKHTQHGSMSVGTPKIKLSGTYLYLEELQTRLDKVIKEVELYMDGKKAPEYEDTFIEFPEDDQDDFESAKVN